MNDHYSNDEELSERQRASLAELVVCLDKLIHDNWSRFGALPLPEAEYLDDHFHLDRVDVAQWAVEHPAVEKLLKSFWRENRMLFRNWADDFEDFCSVVAEAHADENPHLMEFLEQDPRFIALYDAAEAYRERLLRSGHVVVRKLGGNQTGVNVKERIIGSWPKSEIEEGARLGLNRDQVMDVVTRWVWAGYPKAKQ